MQLILWENAPRMSPGAAQHVNNFASGMLKMTTPIWLTVLTFWKSSADKNHIRHGVMSRISLAADKQRMLI